jgi:hypothetical protein
MDIGSSHPAPVAVVCCCDQTPYFCPSLLASFCRYYRQGEVQATKHHQATCFYRQVFDSRLDAAAISKQWSRVKYSSQPQKLATPAEMADTAAAAAAAAAAIVAATAGAADQPPVEPPTKKRQISFLMSWVGLRHQQPQQQQQQPDSQQHQPAGQQQQPDRQQQQPDSQQQQQQRQQQDSSTQDEYFDATA